MTYKCATCKQTFMYSEPAMHNGAGKFCQGCEDRRKAKCSTATRARIESQGSACLWCGEPETWDAVKKSRVCTVCAKNRDWLLKCIRHSNRTADYVAKTEAKELPDRQHRQDQAAIVASKAVIEPANEKKETRLDRLEKMLLKLTEALGGA